MGIKREGVRSLWDTPERIEKAHEVIDRLMKGDVPGVKKLLDKVDGKWDLRGFDFSLRPGDTPFMNYDATGVFRTKTNENHFRDLVLEDIDFSMSLFSNSTWLDCEFRDCVFNRADLYLADFRGCSFKRVRFQDCWIENLLLGGGSEKNLGVFEDVEFIKGTFSRASFGYPRFEHCLFKCNIGHVNFHGSQFYDCVLVGTLNVVRFYGRDDPRPGETYMIGRPIPVNPMRRVDFSKARFKPSFESVNFYGIDMNDCRLPVKGDVFLVKDTTRVFSEVARRIEKEWKSPEKEKGIENAGYYLDKRACPVGQAVIIPERWAKYRGEEFTEAFIKLVKEVMKEVEEEKVRELT